MADTIVSFITRIIQAFLKNNMTAKKYNDITTNYERIVINV